MLQCCNAAMLQWFNAINKKHCRIVKLQNSSYPLFISSSLPTVIIQATLLQ